MSADLPILLFESRTQWEQWLEDHHADSPGAWLKMARKDSGATSLSRADALEVALCYGWIDGQARSTDEGFYLQKYTPRRPRSNWSKINVAAAERLIASGQMRPAGLREVQRAKEDGRWERAYAGPSTIEVPADLQRALDANDAAREFFATLDSRNRYAVLYSVQDAKRADTRARRIARFVAMLAERRKIYP
jgi:uncharacterized protein YdeI (YjbR/CyaY-like superfamily)